MDTFDTFLIIWAGGHENTQLAVFPDFAAAKAVRESWIEDASVDDTIDIYGIEVATSVIWALHPETGATI